MNRSVPYHEMYGKIPQRKPTEICVHCGEKLTYNDLKHADGNHCLICNKGWQETLIELLKDRKQGKQSRTYAFGSDGHKMKGVLR